MFREMRRQKQAIDKDECIRILKEEKRGVMAVLGDDDYPYAMPLNHYYDEKSGHLFFHGAKIGHRVDAVKNHDKVCYCVYDKGYKKEGDWALNIKSVIIFGRIKLVEDFDRAMEMTRELSYKFTGDNEYIESEIEKCGKGTLCMELVPESMTGKLVNES